MLYIRRVLSVALSIALVAGWAGAVSPESRTAASLLAKGQQQFQKKDFAAARTTLWKAHAEKNSLSAAERKTLNGLMGEVDQAVHGQIVARAEVAMAGEAMKDKNWKKARASYAKAADSPFLPAAERTEAKQQLAMVEMKMAAALASADTTKKDLNFGPSVAKSPASVPVKVVSTRTAATSTRGGLSDNQAKNIQVEILVTKGKDALRKGKPAEAVNYFQRALELDPNNSVAKRQLNLARSQTATAGDVDILTDLDKQNRIAKQIAEQEIKSALARSMELMANPTSAETFDAAEQAAKTARSKLQDSKRLFKPGQYREILTKCEDQLTWVKSKRESWRHGRLQKQIHDMNKANADRRNKVARDRQREITQLAMRAGELRNKRQYQAALEVLERITELDPTNEWARENSYVLRQFIILLESKKYSNLTHTEESRLSTEIRSSEIPWYELIRYPKDWKKLTSMRKKYGAVSVSESEEERQLRQKLHQKIPKLNFKGVSFVEVVDFLREVSGANIYVNWKAMEAAGIERTQPIDVTLSDVWFEKALRIILNDVGGGATELGYVLNEGVVTISTREDLDRSKETRVYDIRDLVARVPNFKATRVKLSAIGESLSSGGDSGGGGGGGLFDDDEGDEDGAGEEEPQTKSEAIAKLKTLIQTTIDPGTWMPEGEKGSISTINGNLVITQTGENHRRVEQLISKLRESRTIQVAIESRFITVNTGFLSQIGVDLDFYFNLGSQVAGPTTGAGTAADPYVVRNKGNSAWTNAGYNPNTAVRSLSPVGVQQNSSTFTNILTTATNVANGIGNTMNNLPGGANPAMAIAGTFLDDIQVDFLITATQAHQHTRTLTAPRLTLFNGQRAYVSVQTSRAYISGVEQIVSEQATAPQPIISYAPTGAMLDVDATVSHDRRYVTMTLRPQVVNLQLNEQGDMGGTTVTGVVIGLPVITLQDIQTTVSVPDGGTLLIGGQKLSGEVEREMGVPVLSKLPIVNRAFTNKGKLRDEETLLILIKPQIIINDEVENDDRLYREEKPFSTSYAN